MQENPINVNGKSTLLQVMACCHYKATLNKPLAEPVLAWLYLATWYHWATVSLNNGLASNKQKTITSDWTNDWLHIQTSTVAQVLYTCISQNLVTVLYCHLWIKHINKNTSLQNKIWNLPDRSTILPKFIWYRRKICLTDPNFAGQATRSGTYFQDWNVRTEINFNT